MEECKVCNLYNLDETMAKDLLKEATYPWEVLPKISDYIFFDNLTPEEIVDKAVSYKPIIL